MIAPRPAGSAGTPTPCPFCQAPYGFHEDPCGHFTVQDSWTPGFRGPYWKHGKPTDVVESTYVTADGRAVSVLAYGVDA